MRVFIADDSEVVRMRLSTMLEDIPGVELGGAAETVDQAIEAIHQGRPEVVIVDLYMPGNGVNLIEHLKREEPERTVIVLTNYPYPQYRRRCLQAGADFFFDKSTELLAVVDVLSRLARPGQDGGRGVQ